MPCRFADVSPRLRGRRQLACGTYSSGLPDLDDDLAEGAAIEVVECRVQLGQRVAGGDRRSKTGSVDAIDESGEGARTRDTVG
jgi:hypothetical protein